MAFLMHENIKVLKQRLNWRKNGMLNQLIDALKAWTNLERRHGQLMAAELTVVESRLKAF